jgi:hypothetical protein
MAKRSICENAGEKGKMGQSAYRSTRTATPPSATTVLTGCSITPTSVLCIRRECPNIEVPLFTMAERANVLQAVSTSVTGKWECLNRKPRHVDSCSQTRHQLQSDTSSAALTH